MKKIMLLFCYSGLAGTALSQVWCPPGAVWNFTFAGTNTATSTYGYTEMRYAGDEMAGGLMCKKLERVRYAFGYGSNNPYPPESRFYFTHVANGVIRHLTDANTFDTLANFNLRPGKGWTMTAFRPAACQSITIGLRYTIIDTGYVTINGVNLKYLKIQQGDSATAFSNSVTASVLYERMGDITNYIFRYTWGCGDPADWPFEGRFTCYWDDTFPPYTKTGESCNYNLVGIEEHRSYRMPVIFPNPSSGIFHLTTEIPVRARIYDAIGSLIRIADLSPERSDIDLSGFPAGVYFMQYELDGRKEQVTLIRE